MLFAKRILDSQFFRPRWTFSAVAIAAQLMLLVACQTTTTTPNTLSKNFTEFSERIPGAPLRGEMPPWAGLEVKPIGRVAMNAKIIIEIPKGVGSIELKGFSVWSDTSQNFVSRTDHVTSANIRFEAAGSNWKPTASVELRNAPLMTTVLRRDGSLYSLSYFGVEKNNFISTSGNKDLISLLESTIQNFVRDTIIFRNISLKNNSNIGEKYFHGPLFYEKNNLDNIILPALRRGIAGEAHNKLLSDINNFSNYFDRVSNLVEWKSDMYLRGSWLLDGNEYLEISGDFNLRMSKPPEGEISFGGTATLLIDPYSGNLRASHQNIKFTTQEDNGPVSGQGIYFVEYHLPQSLPSSLSIGVGVAKPQKSGHKTASEIYKTAISSVVEVKSGASVGSGFAIKPDLIVTNSHVLVDGEDVRVVTSSGRELKALRIIDNDAAEIDLAFLRTNESVTNTPLKLSPELPNVGIQALVIGSPGGLAGTLTGGLVSQVRFFKGVRLIQIDASVNRGNSGGPVLNANGEVIGVATKGLKSEKGWVGLNFAISAIEVIEKSPKFLGVNTHK